MTRSTQRSTENQGEKNTWFSELLQDPFLKIALTQSHKEKFVFVRVKSLEKIDEINILLIGLMLYDFFPLSLGVFV